MGLSRRKVLFAAFDVDNDKYTWMSLACGSLLTALCKHGNVGIECTSPLSEEVKASHAVKHTESILSSARSSAPEDTDILFGVYVWNEPLIQSMLPLLRERGLANRIILGGPQIASAPPNALEGYYPQADVFIRGEAEEALAEVTRTADRVDIPGVHYAGDRDDGSLAEPDLATLPSPYLYHAMPIPFERTGRVRWETKRGCPYACTYCQHRGPGRKVREFKRERLFDEMRLFVEANVHPMRILDSAFEAHVHTLTVVDPIFNVGGTYMDIIAELKRLGYAGRLSLQCRFERITDEFLESVRPLDVCLEFGLQTIHAEEGKAIGRKNNLDKVKSVMRALGKMGIDYAADLMYGLPAQTPESFGRSVRFCREHGARSIRAWPLMLLRGTELAEQREKWRLRENAAPIPLVVSSSSFSESEWEEMKVLADEVNRVAKLEAEKKRLGEEMKALADEVNGCPS